MSSAITYREGAMGAAGSHHAGRMGARTQPAAAGLCEVGKLEVAALRGVACR